MENTQQIPPSRNIIYLADTSGTAKWRLIFPTSAIECIGQQQNISITTTQIPILDPNYYKNLGNGSVTVQRWISTQHKNIFMNLLKPVCNNEQSWLIYEIDDVMAGSEIPFFNRGRRAYADKEVQENIRTMLTNADLVTVTTQRLKQFYVDHYGVAEENIVCIPNMILRSWFGDKYDPERKLQQFAKNKAKPRIAIVSSLSHFNIDNIREDKNGKGVWCDKQADGSVKYINEDKEEVKYEDTHPITDDFDEIANVVRDTVKDFQWVFVGNCPKQVEDLLEKKQVIYVPGQVIINYPSALYNLQLQAIVAPIKKIPFNFCKSPIKYLEACAIGVPLYATNCPPYSDVMDKKYLFDDEEDLKAKLLKLKYSSNAVYKSIIEDNWKWLNTPKTPEQTNSDFPLNSLWLDDNINLWVNRLRLRKNAMTISLENVAKQYDERKKKQEEALVLTDDGVVIEQ